MILSRRRALALTGATALAGVLPRDAAAQELTVEAVLRDPDAPVLGNPDGDVTIVEYFDYQCPFCKSMHPILTELLAEDGNIRLVLKDWPIFGAPSVRASQLALGAHDLGRYEAVTEALMATKGRLTQRQVDAAVGEALPARDALRAYRGNRAKWDGLLARNGFQAVALGFRGTPGFAVNTTIYDGALDAEMLRQAIAEARAA
ncbi:DsbA family protein [Salipiger sp. P9]|uniref:DsbA family protein n=1 Tax=Salipiger pentaromativorans TaxID=2943193 RepID=UPI0021588426|nr:DsbA family protein [Salipiger pentaromativorans]MCR8547828.1 DsbA family protein [Salipiger pentaromativorans]